jgi:hypothetical protein
MLMRRASELFRSDSDSSDSDSSDSDSESTTPKPDETKWWSTLKEEIAEAKRELAQLKRDRKKKSHPRQQLSKNYGFLTRGYVCLFVSYNTPVAYVNYETEEIGWFPWPSRTTSKHTSQFLRGIGIADKKRDPRAKVVELSKLLELERVMVEALIKEHDSKIVTQEARVAKLKKQRSKEFICTALKAIARPQPGTPGLHRDVRNHIMQHLDVLGKNYEYKK